MINNKIIHEVGAELAKELDPEQIILFGSYAYGTPTKESDIDILIIKDSDIQSIRPLRLKARKVVRRLQEKYEFGIDIVVDNIERIEYRVNTIKDQFYEGILNNGKVIYAK